jgi:cold shock protein
MRNIKVQLVKYDLSKTKNRKRKDMLVEQRSEHAVIAQLERIHKGESVIKIHEIVWGESTTNEVNRETFFGTVKFFEREKGFGFIRPDEDFEDLFFHGSACAEGIPGDRDRVEFEISEGPKGLSAIRVRLAPYEE